MFGSGSGSGSGSGTESRSGASSGTGDESAGKFVTVLIPILIQWNLRIKDKLVHGPLSTIRGLSFIGGVLSKSLFCVLLLYILLVYKLLWSVLEQILCSPSRSGVYVYRREKLDGA